MVVRIDGRFTSTKRQDLQLLTASPAITPQKSVESLSASFRVHPGTRVSVDYPQNAHVVNSRTELFLEQRWKCSCGSSSCRAS